MVIQLSDHFTYRKLFHFVLPSIVMLVFTSIYGVIDGLFISNFVGKTAFAAINLIMPFCMILGATGFMIGTGGSALVGKILGLGDRKLANRYFSMMVLFTGIVGIILSIVGFLLIRPLTIMLGATKELREESVIYGRILMAFLPTFMFQTLFQCFFATAEKPKLGLAFTVMAGITNILLDALFIVFFKWGVLGAAFATVISQSIGGIFPCIYFLRPNSSLLRLCKTKLETNVIIKACTNGASEMVSDISSALVSTLYNFQLLRFAGENGVAAYGVLMYVNFVFLAISIGYGVGTAPIISFNFGSNNKKELKNMVRKSLLLMTLSGIGMLFLAQILAKPLARIFVGYDSALLEMTSQAFRIFSFSFLLAGLNIFISALFTALNNGTVSAIVSFLRTLVFQLACLFILPMVMGFKGIWFSEVVAEVLSLVVALSLLVSKKKQYGY